ncbi:hypothetical protein [Saccharopolyspora spinosa]|uniref:Uncharacterized protein n=1 Tax=Saccharopolyspora spinosa TaxID=60894 RepID=A0A2N3Y7I8_SACSN|nr:hypothetical protein [Saccharopolyspora spinosa]PKW18870.1 hypothetical protein A8926_7007 [Saccharopolyspora spinosa]
MRTTAKLVLAAAASTGLLLGAQGIASADEEPTFQLPGNVNTWLEESPAAESDFQILPAFDSQQPQQQQQPQQEQQPQQQEPQQQEQQPQQQDGEE